MFWSRNKNPDKQKKSGKDLDKALPARQGSSESMSGGDLGEKGGQRLKGAELRAQALANTRAARERIGEDAIQKIAQALTKKQSSTVEQAKNKIGKTDSGRVRDEIRFLMDEE